MTRAFSFLIFLIVASLAVFSKADKDSEKTVCSEGQKYAHEKYCDRFYKCVNGTKVLQKCHLRWMFDADPKTQNCRSPLSEVDCSNRPYSDPTSKTYLGKQRPKCKKGQPTRYYAHEYSCDLYYKCENGTEQMERCWRPAVFDDKGKPEVLSCKLDYEYNQVDCSYRPFKTIAKATCPRKKNDYIFGEQKDCRVFGECDNDGKASINQCGEGKVYNGKERSRYWTFDNCDYPDLVHRQGLTCDFESLLGLRCPQTPHYFPGNISRLSSKTIQRRSKLTNGKLRQETIPDLLNPRIAYPGSCWYYFECILTEDGTRRPRIKSCPSGLVYQPQTSVCVVPSLWPKCKKWIAEFNAKVKYYIDLTYT